MKTIIVMRLSIIIARDNINVTASQDTHSGNENISFAAGRNSFSTY